MSEQYVCPKCGEDDWEADYYQAVHQGCSVEIENGKIVLTDWDGDEETYDDGSTEEELIKCRSCDYTITFGEFRFVPKAAQKASGQ
jgi:predicted nucleic-acid-binding Zn-ribbon protein